MSASFHSVIGFNLHCVVQMRFGIGQYQCNVFLEAATCKKYMVGELEELPNELCSLEAMELYTEVEFIISFPRSTLSSSRDYTDLEVSTSWFWTPSMY